MPVAQHALDEIEHRWFGGVELRHEIGATERLVRAVGVEVKELGEFGVAGLGGQELWHGFAAVVEHAVEQHADASGTSIRC